MGAIINQHSSPIVANWGQTYNTSQEGSLFLANGMKTKWHGSTVLISGWTKVT